MKFRAPVELPDSTNRSLSMYVLAASAAGVSLVAMSAPAEAKIIYTPTHVVILPNHMLAFDLNNDGVTDFTFEDVLATTSVGEYRSDRLFMVPVGNNEIWGHKLPTGLRYASALPPGVTVGASGAFSAGTRSLAYGADDVGSMYCEGKWNDVRNRYLGLKFTIQGKTHFGWARMTVACKGFKVGGLLTGYAYETVANRPIVTGKREDSQDESSSASSMTTPEPLPGSLGMLAHGASGLTAWRRRE